MESNKASHDGNAPVVVDGLSRRFRRKLALDDVSVEVPKGKVFGLVGENGAGKTTLIKHILGLLVPTTGSVRVFGMDPVAEPERVLARIGYLSENRDLPNWMRISELMRFMRAFYPDWDQKYADELIETFDLDPTEKVKNLSRGERAQTGLLIALAHRPELLVLDEPSSGLDPVVRRDILSAVIRAAAEEGRTVLFSSHLLDEVDRVADVVTMIHKGRVVLSASTDELRETHSLVTLRFTTPLAAAPSLPGALSCEGAGEEWTVLSNGGVDALRAAAQGMGAAIVDERPPSLEDIFVARVRASHHSARRNA
jgi:ABC-2 type transport system ATP-binding protein